MPDWLVEKLRCTVFLDVENMESVDPQEWWDSTIGESPEQTVTKPRERDFQFSKDHFGGSVTLQSQPTRADWQLFGKRPEDELPSLPILGPVSEYFPTFLKIVQPWLGNLPPIKRIAFGAVLLIPVRNHQDGYQTLSIFLPDMNIDVEKSSDFTYQINRPRDSSTSIDGLEINRLSKWSVLLARGFTISVLGNAETVELPDGLYAVRLELDINTNPDFKDPLLGKDLPAIFQELVENATEIGAKGDIK